MPGILLVAGGVPPPGRGIVAVNHRTGRAIRSEGDLFVAYCSCGWVSEGFDTTKEAKAAHIEHAVSARLKGA